jgi:hypothetical protein
MAELTRTAQMRYDSSRWLHELSRALEQASSEADAPCGDLSWLTRRCEDTMSMDGDILASSLWHLARSVAETLRSYPTALPGLLLEAAMHAPGDDLPCALLRTEAFALGLPGAPRWKSVVLGPPLELSAGKLGRISYEEVVAADAFVERFEQLLSLGFPWINLSAAGLLRGALLVTVETAAITRGDIRATSINISGPVAFVRQRTGWRLDDLVEIRGAP